MKITISQQSWIRIQELTPRFLVTLSKFLNLVESQFADFKNGYHRALSHEAAERFKWDNKRKGPEQWLEHNKLQ